MNSLKSGMVQYNWRITNTVLESFYLGKAESDVGGCSLLGLTLVLYMIVASREIKTRVKPTVMDGKR